jgi:hypothetical protein
MPAPGEVLRLVERFENDKGALKLKTYNETQVRTDYINPFFEALGWEVQARSETRQVHREVVLEDTLKTESGTKAPDYCFYLDDKRQFFLEAKKPALSLREDPAPAFQVRRYGWSAKLPVSVVTDFEELAVYDCRVEPHPTDKAGMARALYFEFTEYDKRWDEIHALLSKEAVQAGSLERLVGDRPLPRANATVDAAFLGEISEWRKRLAESLAHHNPQLTQSEVNFAVQMTIDRMLFLRICEDRGIETRESMDGLREGVGIYGKLGDLFKDADERYNSGLFHFKKERRGGSSPDDLTLKLRIDDDTLRFILKRLYPPYSPYAFRVIPVEILGQVYEQFLGKVIRLNERTHGAVVEDKPEVRKAGGVYYTPSYIVEYIVKQTVGKLLEGKKPKEVEKLRILDPACGSGSFLLGAYQYLLDWHRDWYVKEGLQKYTKEIEEVRGVYRVTLEKRKSILRNNIFGVDIDQQAVEVTKLSLMLQMLDGETEKTVGFQRSFYHEPALPDLDSNIKCGNSLIWYDFLQTEQAKGLSQEELDRVNVFDWNEAFPEIMKAGGFNAVIGNPPYVRPHYLDPAWKEYFWQHFKTFVGKSDLYCCFVERGISLLRRQGMFGFIISNGWLRLDSFETLRAFLLSETALQRIIDFTGYVFKNANVRASVLLASKQEPKNQQVEVATTEPTPYLDQLKLKKIQQEAFGASYKHIFDLSISDLHDPIKKKMRHSGVALGDLFEISFGLKTGDDARFLTYAPENDTYKPLLRGEDVHRYSSIFKGEYVKYVPKEMIAHRKTARPGSAQRFEQPKLLVRDTGNSLEGTFDGADYYVKDVLVVSDGAKNPDSLKYLTGILNSRLMKFYYETSFPTLHVQRDELASLPVRTINFSDPKDKKRHDDMVRLVEDMLRLHKELAEARTHPQKVRTQRHIAATDRQIDRLVYELYGLTEEEIRVVEGGG